MKRIARRANGAAALICIVGWLVAPSAVRSDLASELRSAVEHAAAEAAVRQVSSPDRFEVLSARFVGADPLPAGRLGLELLEVDGPNRSGYTRLRFRTTVDGTARGLAYASVRGVVRGPVLVARSTLIAGRTIAPAAVEQADEDLTRISGDPLRDVAELAGKVPLRSLGAGRPITTDLLKPRPVVRRGETVDLKVRRGSLTVTAQGTVKRDGAPGETVPVRNLRSGAELVGRVQDDGSVLVLRGAARGRK